MMNEIVKAIWFVPLELNHSSYIYTSLICFCERLKIKFEISETNLNLRGVIDVSNNYKVENAYFEKVCYIKFIKADKSSILLAFDFYDLPHRFSKFAYDNADYVFKRSYQTEILAKLPVEYKSKTRRFGLPFMVRPSIMKNSLKFKSLYVVYNFKRFLKFDRNIVKRVFKSFKYSFKTWQDFKNTRTVSEFENRIDSNNLNIFFQKRLFPYEENNDVKKIHDERIKIVNLLRNHYAGKFLGGIQVSRMARLKCPESISNISTQHEFLTAFKSAEICIYTRGLSNSTGWTLSEFLAQGKCIIAEQIYNEIPVPLEDQQEVIFFEDDKDLLKKIDLILMNQMQRNTLKQNALNYYSNYVSPNVFFENLISSF